MVKSMTTALCTPVPMSPFNISTPEPVSGALSFVPIVNDDGLHLRSYESKLTVIRDCVRGVVLRFATDFFLCRDGGISESHTVLNELEKLRADHKPFNSRMSGRRLFRALCAALCVVSGQRTSRR